MPVNLPKFDGPGSTSIRRKFWDTAVEAVLLSRKREGKNVSIDVHDGYGSVINVKPQRSGTQQLATGACCTDGECAIATLADCESGGGNYLGNYTTCDDVDCTQGACCDPDSGDCSITTLEECLGDYQGDGTVCDPNPCTQVTGACCNAGDCSIQTEIDCLGSGGVYMGDDVPCSPDPCTLVDCPCGFLAFDGSGRRFLTQSASGHVTENYEAGPCSLTLSGIETLTYDPDTCDLSVASCSGSGNYSYPGFGCDNALSFAACGEPNPCCCLQEDLDCGNCPGACDTVPNTICISGIAPLSGLVVVSATQAYRECSNEFGDQRVDIVLSDECNPI